MLELWIQLQLWFAGLRDEEQGASAVEYGLMVALIAAVIIGVVGTLGTNLQGMFKTVADAIP